MTQAAPKHLAEKFFRREYAKMVATLVKFLGPDHVALAEDMVQDTLLEAMKDWEYQGIPEKPAAWLYKVARNKTLNHLKQEANRGQLRAKYLPELHEDGPEVDFDQSLKDNQLTMMFVCCHPAIPQTSQIALMLKTLCGLSISEIANAFLTTSETINKRLVRARKVLREHQISFELPPKQVSQKRLSTVQKTLLLLFNEGYSTTQGDLLIKEDLCLEAIRLTETILESQAFIDNSDTHALLALMYFNVSRFQTRMDENGQILELSQQDRSQWNAELIQQGIQHLSEIQDSQQLSFYKVTAAIAAHHSTAPHYNRTDWKAILGLYDILVQVENSPLVQINRAVAVSQVHGYHQALADITSINEALVVNYHHYYAVLGEFHGQLKEFGKAQEFLEKALDLVTSAPERRHLLQKLSTCKTKINP